MRTTTRRRLALLALGTVVAVTSAACTGGAAGRLDAEGPTSSAGELAIDAGTGEAAFCSKVLDVLGRYKDVFADPTGGAVASDPAAALQQVKAMGARLAPPMRELAAAAPADVGPALEKMSAGFEAMASGDLTSMAGAASEMGTAGQQFGDYLATKCQSIGSSGLDAITGAFSGAVPGATEGQAPQGDQNVTTPTGSGPAQGDAGERGPYAPPSPLPR